MAYNFCDMAGATVAVVGCGGYPAGKGLGRRIDSSQVVIRVNRSFLTAGIEEDYGKRTDLLVVGNRKAILPLLPPSRGFSVCPVWGNPGKDDQDRAQLAQGFGFDSSMPEADFKAAWTYPTPPLAGTFAAVLAAFYGCASLLLVGLDLYKDDLSLQGVSMFPGHRNIRNQRTAHNYLNDAAALEALGSKTALNWIRP